MPMMSTLSSQLSPPVRFSDVRWADVPDAPGAYAIYDKEESLYVGMAGRDGKGTLRRRLRDGDELPRPGSPRGAAPDLPALTPVRAAAPAAKDTC